MINKFIQPTELQPMQFHSTWDSEFNRIVQGLNPCGTSLCQSQLGIENKPKPRGLAIRRQECRAINTDQLTKSHENYSPLSDLVNWEQLRNKETFAVKKYRQSAYLGQFTEGKRTGLGVMLYTNNRVYEGEWFNNFKHGKGYEKFPNGALYSGTYVNGKPQGYGTYSWENGETYQGQWLDGMKSGSGIWRGPNGDSYIGEWKNGQANGYGVHTWVNGDRYEGQFKDCLKHGEGIEKFANGDSYKGTYVMGKPHGYGEYYWGIGSFYKGNFEYGMRSGKGTWKRGPGNSDRYEGDYKDDKKEGYGVYVWQNGTIYKGNFSDDLRNGYGEMYWTNGKIFKGQWVDNQQGGGIQQFNPKVEQHNIETERYRNEQLESRSSRGRLKYKKSDNQLKEPQQYDFFEAQAGFFQEPCPPEMSETQRKFRAREITNKRQIRTESHKSSRSQNHGNTQEQNKFVRKYSVGSRCSTNKKIKQGNSQTKMMSSTFFLYKIHSNSPGLEDSYVKPKPRQVKTSGGMRQKHISEEIKYFTRNKINPELL